VRIGRLAADRGLDFISAETRGRGFGTWLRGPAGTRLAGSAWELLTEAPSDVGAWIASRGSDGIDGVVLASSGSLVRDNLDPTLADAAARAVAEGRGLDLMPFGSRSGLGPNTVSAQVYAMRARVQHELYGAADKPPALARVDVPILAWFGDSEQSAERDVRGFLDTIRRNAVLSPRVETAMLGGASYLYTGAEAVVADTLATWVGSLRRPVAGRRAVQR
jgi:hypothetical protein